MILLWAKIIVTVSALAIGIFLAVKTRPQPIQYVNDYSRNYRPPPPSPPRTRRRRQTDGAGCSHDADKTRAASPPVRDEEIRPTSPESVEEEIPLNANDACWLNDETKSAGDRATSPETVSSLGDEVDGEPPSPPKTRRRRQTDGAGCSHDADKTRAASPPVRDEEIRPTSPESVEEEIPLNADDAWWLNDQTKSAGDRATSPETISSLGDEVDGEPQKLCSICLRHLKNNLLRKLCCNHVFHHVCVTDWIAKSSNCPMCRTELV